MMTDVIYLSPVATFPSSRSVSCPSCHNMTIPSPKAICPRDKQWQGLSRCFKKGVMNSTCKTRSDKLGGSETKCTATSSFGVILYTYLQTEMSSPVYMDRYFRFQASLMASICNSVGVSHE